MKSQFDAVLGNVGLGVLPCYMARGHNLELIMPDDITFQRTYWMTYLEEYRLLERIYYTIEFIFDSTRGMAEIFKYSAQTDGPFS